MVKKMLIDATHAEETRVVVVDGNKVDDFDFESLARKQLSGNIYLAKVTRVEPSLQAAFVEYGGNRQGFLAFSEIHSDYYQIPVSDREALAAEEAQERARQLHQDELEDQAAEQREQADNDLITTVESNVPLGMEVGMSPHENDNEEDSEGDNQTDVSDFSTSQLNHEDNESISDENFEEKPDESPKKMRAKRYKIQEVIKKNQIVLVQVVKEERGNKGAALTTYISLAGRYCVLMPNTPKGGGISRKITNIPDRKRLREMIRQFDIPEGMGLIVRTAGADRTETEIQRDYAYLLRQWDATRTLTFQSVSPALIYEEANLIKRSLRDLYDPDIESVWVEGKKGYEEASAYMKMLVPTKEKYVKQYQDKVPLYIRYQVEKQLLNMFDPTVQLKSGGYIVIDITEALVSVDVNSGRSTKEKSIENTALKTNLEAAQEVARQLKLRDMAGLVVIDFIDMDDHKNNRAVEKQLKESLKSDRARIQVGRISSFGLLEMSRQRLRPGIVETTTNTCPACKGTGVVRSDENISLAILRQIEETCATAKFGSNGNSVDVHCSIPVANYIINQKRSYLYNIETRHNIQIFINSNLKFIHQNEYSIEIIKTENDLRTLPQETINAESVYQSLQDMPQTIDDAEVGIPEQFVVDKSTDDNDEQQQQPKKKRRRGRRGGGRKPKTDVANEESGTVEVNDSDSASTLEEKSDTVVQDNKNNDTDNASKPKKPTRQRRSRTRKTPVVIKENEDTIGEIVEAVDIVVKTESTNSSLLTPSEQSDHSSTAHEEQQQKNDVQDEKIITDTPTLSPSSESSAPDAPQNNSVSPSSDDGTPPKRRGWWAKVLS